MRSTLNFKNVFLTFLSLIVLSLLLTPFIVGKIAKSKIEDAFQKLPKDAYELQIHSGWLRSTVDLRLYNTLLTEKLNLPSFLLTKEPIHLTGMLWHGTLIYDDKQKALKPYYFVFNGEIITSSRQPLATEIKLPLFTKLVHSVFNHNDKTKPISGDMLVDYEAKSYQGAFLLNHVRLPLALDYQATIPKTVITLSGNPAKSTQSFIIPKLEINNIDNETWSIYSINYTGKQMVVEDRLQTTHQIQYDNLAFQDADYGPAEATFKLDGLDVDIINSSLLNLRVNGIQSRKGLSRLLNQLTESLPKANLTAHAKLPSGLLDMSGHIEINKPRFQLRGLFGSPWLFLMNAVDAKVDLQMPKSWSDTLVGSLSRKDLPDFLIALIHQKYLRLLNEYEVMQSEERIQIKLRLQQGNITLNQKPLLPLLLSSVGNLFTGNLF